LTRTAFVTGASSGIGRACAVALQRSGWRVLAGVRREGDAPADTQEVLLDVTDEDQVRTAAERVEELDGLVNNAGIALAGPLEIVPIAELRHQLDVNVVGQVAVTQAFLPALRRRRGRIVFIGSIAGRSALPFLGPYAASKHALEAIADSLRVELRPFGIRVSIVEPGTIKTAIWTRSAARADELIATLPDNRLDELYGDRIDAFRRIAMQRGNAGAPAETVASVVVDALTATRPRSRYLVGRDAKLRAGFERLPDRLRDRVYERVLLRG
jgi:NAD(P)-dependent dehydrogenase (short-subunit alcohol dehydrogenase family)